MPSLKHHGQMSEAFITALFLSVSGGLQDVYTYLFRGKVFANAQTGNIVLMSVHAFAGEWGEALRYLVPLCAFALGIFAAEFIRLKLREMQWLHWRQLVVLFEILLLFVVGGYLLYSAMFAAVGSAVDNAQDAAQLQTPIMIPIILAVIVEMSVLNDPNSPLAFWFSLIPFTSPVVMMARIPYGIPTWEIVLSLVLLYAAFVGMVWLSAKIYRVGIFMYGKKPTLREMFRWIRYKY